MIFLMFNNLLLVLVGSFVFIRFIINIVYFYLLVIIVKVIIGFCVVWDLKYLICL